MSVYAEIEVAQNYDDVTRFLEENQDDTVALLFMDSSASSQSSGGVFSGIFSSIGSIFSGSGDDGSKEDQVAKIEKEISDEAALMQIDVSKEDLKEIQESYDVTQIPFLIVFKRGIVVLKEVPDKETHDEILQVMNVTPAAVEEESEPVPTEETTVVEEVPVEETPAEETPEPEPTPVEDETVVIPISVRQEEPTPVQPIILRPVPETPAETRKVSLKEPEKAFTNDINNDEGVATYVPRSFELTRTVGDAQPSAEKPTTQEQVTLAPAETQPKVDSSAQEIPAAKPTQPTRPTRPTPPPLSAQHEGDHVDPDTRRKYVFHKCHQMGTHNDCEPLDWRTNPQYIQELEDYEIPEDWWRNGYAPITDGNNVADNRTRECRENCAVPPPTVEFVPPQPHVHPVPEPVHLVREPVHVVPEPAHIVRAPEPAHVVRAHEPAHVVRAPEPVFVNRTAAPVRVSEAPVRVHEVAARQPVVVESAPRFVGQKYTGRNATVVPERIASPARPVREVAPQPAVSERVVSSRLGPHGHTVSSGPVKTSPRTVRRS